MHASLSLAFSTGLEEKETEDTAQNIKKYPNVCVNGSALITHAMPLSVHSMYFGILGNTSSSVTFMATILYKLTDYRIRTRCQSHVLASLLVTAQSYKMSYI